MRFIKTVVIVFTLWLTTAAINALLAGSWLYFFTLEFDGSANCYVIVLIATLLCSIPGFLIIWLVLLVNRNDKNLFRILLETGLLVSTVSAFFGLLLWSALKHTIFFLGGLTVVSFIVSIMCHHFLVRLFFTSQIIHHE